MKKTAVTGGLKPLVYQTFCIYLENYILNLSRKNQGKVKEFCKAMSAATIRNHLSSLADEDEQCSNRNVGCVEVLIAPPPPPPVGVTSI